MSEAIRRLSAGMSRPADLLCAVEVGHQIAIDVQEGDRHRLTAVILQGVRLAADAGATAVIQPGGSIRDDDVIAAADEAGLAMLFTGMRHFRH